MHYNNSADGLRGFAALNVVLAHFIAAFIPTLLHYNYPTAFNKNPDPSILYDIIQFPLISLLYNGHLAVIVFFILSGYVLTIPAFNNNIISIKKRLWGRYLRLNIPIIFSLIFAYFILKYNLFYNVQASDLSSSNWLSNYYNKQITFSEFLSMLFYESIILGKSYLNPPLWTIKIEFIGSLFLLIFYSVKPNDNIKKDFILLVILFIFLYIIYGKSSIYFYAMFIGALLNHVKIIYRKKTIIFFLIIGIYFGAFQYNGYYNYLPNISINNYEIFIKKDFYNTLGAIFIVLSVINGGLKNIFSSKIGLYFGKISYSMYLLHMIILCSIISYFYITFPNINKLYLFINLMVYLMIVIVLSHVFTKYIDKLAINLSHKFSNYIFK